MTGELIDIFPTQMWATGNDTAGSWTAEKPTGRWALVGSAPLLCVLYTRSDLVAAQRASDFRNGMLAAAAWHEQRAAEILVRVGKTVPHDTHLDSADEIRAIADDPEKMAAMMKEVQG
jgi:hypothetical protein